MIYLKEHELFTLEDLDAALQGMSAVSYTHLDVYKRQNQEKGHIKILSHAKVRQGHLYYERSDQLR